MHFDTFGSVQCAQGTVQCVVYTVNCAVCTVDCEPCSVSCAVCCPSDKVLHIVATVSPTRDHCDVEKDTGEIGKIF